MEPGASAAELAADVNHQLGLAEQAILAIDPAAFGEPRWVGRRRLPTTVIGWWRALYAQRDFSKRRRISPATRISTGIALKRIWRRPMCRRRARRLLDAWAGRHCIDPGLGLPRPMRYRPVSALHFREACSSAAVPTKVSLLTRSLPKSVRTVLTSVA